MRSLLLTLALVVAIGGSAVHAAAPLADRLPADAIAYVGWAGRNHAFDGSRIGSLLEQIHLDLATPAAAEGKQSSPMHRRLRDRLWRMAAIAARHKMAICVVPAGADAGKTPGIALVADLGKDRPAFDEHLQAAWAAIAETAEVAEVTDGPITYKTATVGPDKLALAAGYIDDMVFITLGPHTPAKLIALRDAADRSLLNAAKFTMAHEDVAGENEQLSVYLDVPAVLQVFRRAHPENGEKLARQLDVVGLGQATAYVSSIRVVDRGLYRRTRVITPAPHHGIAALLAGPPLTPNDLAAAPTDTCGLLAWRIDPAAARTQLLWSLAKLNPHAVESFAEAEANVNKLLGVDLASCLGDRAMIVCAPSLGGLLTGTALIIDLADPAALAEALDRLYAAYDLAPMDLRALGIPALRRTVVGQTTVGFLPMPSIAPAWAIHNDKLIVAGWPQVVGAVIDRAGQPGLSRESALQDGWGHLAAAPMAVGYLDTPKLLRQTYGLWLALWPRVTRALEPGSMWLPSLPTLEAHLQPTVSGLAADDQGLTGESFGTLPSLLADPLLVCLAVGVALDGIVEADTGSRQRASMARLGNIGKALALYATGHDDARPADLHTLVAAGLIAPDQLNAADTYIPLPANAEAHLIFIYQDPATDEPNQTAVLFADYSAATMPVDKRFWDLVEMSKAAAAGKSK